MELFSCQLWTSKLEPVNDLGPHRYLWHVALCTLQWPVWALVSREQFSWHTCLGIQTVNCWYENSPTCVSSALSQQRCVHFNQISTTHRLPLFYVKRNEMVILFDPSSFLFSWSAISPLVFSDLPLPLPVPQRKLVHAPGVSDRCKALTAVLFVARSKPGRSHQRLPGHDDHSSAKYRLSSQRSVTLERCLILSFFCLLLCLNFWSPSALKSAIIPQRLISLVENGAAVINLSSR